MVVGKFFELSLGFVWNKFDYGNNIVIYKREEIEMHW